MNIDPQAVKQHLSRMKAQFMDLYGISVREMAKQADIPRARLAKLFDGRGTPTMDEILGLQMAFDYFFDKLVKKTNKEVTSASTDTNGDSKKVTEVELYSLEQPNG